MIFRLSEPKKRLYQHSHVAHGLWRQAAFSVQPSVILQMPQEVRKSFRRQLGNRRLSEPRKNVPFDHEAVPFARGGFHIRLRKVLRKKLFYRQIAGCGRLLCQRLNCRQLLFLDNIMRFSIDRLVLRPAIRQTHCDITPFPAAILAAVDVFSVPRQLLHLSFYQNHDGKYKAISFRIGSRTSGYPCSERKT